MPSRPKVRFDELILDKPDKSDPMNFQIVIAFKEVTERRDDRRRKMAFFFDCNHLKYGRLPSLWTRNRCIQRLREHFRVEPEVLLASIDYEPSDARAVDLKPFRIIDGTGPDPVELPL